MVTINARRARLLAAWAGVACAALLATGCNSDGTAAGPVTGPATPVSTAPATGPTANTTFLAEGQDINGTVLHTPGCTSGCVLSGDSTAILDQMTWTSWSGRAATGTGTYEIDGCNPNCAAGPLYKVPAMVTLSNPVRACSSSGTRYFWTKATFRYPRGLPAALRGANAPQDPWVFSSVITAAQQSCAR